MTKNLNSSNRLYPVLYRVPITKPMDSLLSAIHYNSQLNWVHLRYSVHAVYFILHKLNMYYGCSIEMECDF